MRVNTKGGVPPCDRRLDHRKVAVAAAAALFLFATAPARAGVVDFEIVQPLSFSSLIQTIDLSEIGSGISVTVAQYPDTDGAGPITGSDVTSIFGNILADIQPTTVEMIPGGQFTWAVNNTPGFGGVPGLYSPFDPVTVDPAGPPGGVNPSSNFGITAAGIGLFQIIHGGHGDWFTLPSVANGGSLTGESGPRTLTGTSFPYSPGDDALLGAGGRLASSSLLAVSTGDLVGSVLAAFGSAGLATGDWDPAAGLNGVLTLPIESSFSTLLDLSSILPGAVGTVTFSSFGVIVATPKVPEPSSLVLLGFGIIGLLTYGLRLRKRSV